MPHMQNLIRATMWLVLAAALGACHSTTAQCKDRCESQNDCTSEQICSGNFLGGSVPVCIPATCKTCSEQGKSCRVTDEGGGTCSAKCQ